MKALTLWQPWASLIALGAKTIETRSWETSYRGPVAIHASRGGLPRHELEPLLHERAFSVALAPLRRNPESGILLVEDLPRGAIVAIARMNACVPTEAAMPGEIGADRPFGDFSPGRFMWFLEDVRPLLSPISCRGAQGLWNVPADVERAIAEQLAGRTS